MRRVAVLVSVFALVVAGCASATEGITEQIIEQSSGGEADVDLDLDSGQVSVETEDGSISIGGGDIPDGFPVPFPDGGDVQSTFTSDDAAAVSVAYARDRYDELVGYYENWVAGQPGEWSTSSFTNDDGSGGVIRGSSWWQGSDISIGVTDCFTVGGDGDGLNGACVSVNTQS